MRNCMRAIKIWEEAWSINRKLPSQDGDLRVIGSKFFMDPVGLKMRAQLKFIDSPDIDSDSYSPEDEDCFSFRSE